MTRSLEIASREIRKSRGKAGLGGKLTILIEMQTHQNGRQALRVYVRF